MYSSSSRVGVGRSRVALPQPAAQHVGRGLQVDHEVGHRQVRGQQLVEPLVDEQLVVVEVQVGVDLVALEEVVAERQLAEEIELAQRGLLPMACQRVEELRLERGAGAARLSVGEERIVGFVEDDRRIEAGAETIGEPRLADADGPSIAMYRKSKPSAVYSAAGPESVRLRSRITAWANSGEASPEPWRSRRVR